MRTGRQRRSLVPLLPINLRVRQMCRSGDAQQALVGLRHAVNDGSACVLRYSSDICIRRILNNHSILSKGLDIE